MPSLLERDLTEEQKILCEYLEIDITLPHRVRYRDGVVVAVDGIPLTTERPENLHFVQPDIDAYESPIDGKIVDGRRQRREDLRRSGSRPYEGFEQESKEAARYRAEQASKTDQLAEKMAHRAWAEAPERIRKVFRGR
jgi:hypothetical protein